MHYIRMKMKIPNNIAPCGINCRLCPDYEHFPYGFSELSSRLFLLIKRFSYSIEIARKEGKFSTDDFINCLKWFSEQKNTCNGCLETPSQSDSPLLPGCDPNCPIRKCANEKNVQLCAFCEHFPCEHSSYSERGLSNLERIKEVGLERWLKEEEEKVKSFLE